MTTVDYLSAINNSGSGLNITQIVDSLVNAEKLPQENIIQGKIDKKNTSISAIGEVKSALSVLSSSLSVLTGNTSLKTSSTGSALSATIINPSEASTINSSISISTIAKGQTLAFSGYSSNTSVVGAGALTLERGDWSSGSFVASSSVSSTSITVSSTDTLESLKDKINDLNCRIDCLEKDLRLTTLELKFWKDTYFDLEEEHKDTMDRLMDAYNISSPDE